MNAGSNHPPSILKNIPIGVHKRLCEISAIKEVFDLAAPLYQAELDRCGYKHQLKFSPPETETVSRKKNKNNNRITWFNPPYSLNVETNIGRIFLQLLDSHFPPGHRLRSVMNRNNIKIKLQRTAQYGKLHGQT